MLVYADDLGYGDIGPFGSKLNRTPHLDRMAAEGMRFTSFYSAAEVCTPSRAALMTGRLPLRNGMCNDQRRVLFPDSAGGLPASEVTLAAALRDLGYATACVGKWHLGHLPPYLPTNNGFDSYFGIPYSNDMDRVADAPKGREAFWNPRSGYFNVPLMRDLAVVERPADQATITERYTEETIGLIRKLKDRPFFIYLAHNLPHVPLFASKDALGTSLRGRYGDVVEEIDRGVGRILDTLREHRLEKNTLVIFTSDNGPWLSYGNHAGSALPLREGKGTCWDGGHREPFIARWPGRSAPGSASPLRLRAKQ